jgi:pantoate--beta-alanine ligase
MILSEPIIKIDYLKIVDYDSLKEFNNIIDNKFAICIAVYINSTRLIDNIYQ